MILVLLKIGMHNWIGYINIVKTMKRHIYNILFLEY